MSALQEAEKLLAVMSKAEKAQLLQHVAKDLEMRFEALKATRCLWRRPQHHPHPYSRLDARTHATLGITEAELLKSYPTLRAEDLVHAWAYVQVHENDINHQTRENEEPF